MKAFPKELRIPQGLRSITSSALKFLLSFLMLLSQAPGLTLGEGKCRSGKPLLASYAQGC
jgi:hypothetical protein